MNFIKRNTRYIIIGVLGLALILILISFFSNTATSKEEKNNTNYLNLLYSEAGFNITTKPVRGDYVTKRNIEIVTNLAIEDKVLCQVGGLYNIKLDENFEPKSLFCTELSNMDNKIITPIIDLTK